MVTRPAVIWWETAGAPVRCHRGHSIAAGQAHLCWWQGSTRVIWCCNCYTMVYGPLPVGLPEQLRLL